MPLVLLVCGMLVTCVAHRKILPITLSKGLCNGICPEFSATLRADGTVQFEGRTHTKFRGKVSKKLSPHQKKELLDAFRQIDLSALKTQYDQHLYDVPETRLQYGEKEVYFKQFESVPETVKTFVKMLDDALREEGWLY